MLAWTLAACTPEAPYRIIFLGPLTGPNASLGVDGLKGAQLALQKWNDRGGVRGIPLELMVLDDENNPATGLKLLQEVSWDRVLGVILHTTSSASMEVVPYLNSREVLTFSRTVSTPFWSGKDDYLIRFAGNTEHFGVALGKMVVESGKNDVAIAYEAGNKTYAEAIFTGIASAFPQLKLRTPMTFDTWESLEASGRDQTLLSGPPEALLVIASGLNCAKAAQNLSRRKLTIPLFVSPWAHNQILAEYAGDYAPLIEVLGTTDPGSQNPDYLAFLDDYEEFYGLKPSNFAIFGYEVTGFFLDAVEGAGSQNSQAVKEWILKRGTVQGLQDRIVLDIYGDASYSTYRIGIRNGNFYRKN